MQPNVEVVVSCVLQEAAVKVWPFLTKPPCFSWRSDHHGCRACPTGPTDPVTTASFSRGSLSYRLPRMPFGALWNLGCRTDMTGFALLSTLAFIPRGSLVLRLRIDILGLAYVTTAALALRGSSPQRLPRLNYGTHECRGYRTYTTGLRLPTTVALPQRDSRF